MTTPLDRLDASTRALKRAQYESFDFHLTDEGVRVRNESHAAPDEHVYTVTVADGLPTRCTCLADEHHEGACKHRLAVAIRDPVLDAAVVHATTSDPDEQAGGNPDEDGDEDEDDGEDDEGDPGAPPVVVADGGGETAVQEGDAADGPPGDDRPADCDCANLGGDFPCWPCVRDGRREVPAATDSCDDRTTDDR